MARKKPGRFYREMNIRRAFIAAAPFCLAAAAGQDLSATTYTATDVATLRTAIDSANAAGSDDIIELATGTYNLTGARLDNMNMSGDLDITKASGNLTIRPATGATVFVDANGSDRVFHINAGTGVTVTIEDIRLQSGYANDDGNSASEARGGGILLEQGNLTLNNVAVDSCLASGTSGSSGSSGSNGGNGTSAYGGGIYVAGGTVSLTSCSLNGCGAFGGGGGSGGSGSSSSGTDGGDGGDGGDARGGGIYVAGGTVSLTDTALVSLSAYGGNGGGGGNGASSSSRSAYGGDGGNGGNGGVGEGGAIYVAAGTLSILRGSLINGTGSGGSGGSGGGGGSAYASSSSSISANGGDGGSGGTGGAGSGGGVFVAGGVTATITNCTIYGNSAAGGNGGSGGDGDSGYASYASFASADGGQGGAGGNGGSASGGGLYLAFGAVSAPNVTILASTVSNNSATGGSGGSGGSGGDGTVGSSRTVFVSSSGAGGAGGVGGTGAAGQGGGCFVSASGVLTLVSSTISGNDATSGDGGDGGNGGNGVADGGAPSGSAEVAGTGGDGGDSPAGSGGGIFATGASLDIDNSTIASNSANSGSEGFGGSSGSGTTGGGSGSDGNATNSVGGGLFGTGGTVTLDSSIVADNSADNDADVSMTITANNSLIEDTTGATITGSNNVTATDPGLGILQDNGGPTFTHAITTGSPALNVGSNSLSLANDQRGAPYARDDGNGVDIGAFEFQVITASPVVTDPASTQMVTVGTYDIVGTAVSDSLVRIYNDVNDNGFVDTGDTMVASQQLSGGGTSFTISTPLSTGDNNFLATAQVATNGESAPTDVPTINTTAVPTTGGGSGDDDESCSTGNSRGPAWMLLAAIAAMFGVALRTARRE